MSEALSRSVRLFLVDGTAKGITTAEIVNWTGRVLFTPRSRLAEALTRPEAKRTGVYILLGEDPNQPTKQLVYVGESDDVAKRIRQHASDANKEFWSEACIVTSKDENLTKAHARYLESRMIDRALLAGRANVSNGTEPPIKSLPEADVADMEFFLAQLEIILPIFGFDFLRSPRSVGSQNAEDADPVRAGTLELQLAPRAHGILASALEQDGDFTVLSGSRAVTEKFATNIYSGLREQLIQDGRLKSTADPKYLQFEGDVIFKSPSAAAAVILNRNANGRTEWRLKSTNKSLKEYQDSNLAGLDSANLAAQAPLLLHSE